jgi:IS30 family transposase
VNFKHLSLEERHYMEIQHKLGATNSAIGRALNRSHTTIGRELNRNVGQRGYRYQQAQIKTQKRHALKPKAIKLTPELKQEIDADLAEGWSPEQIGGRLTQQGKPSFHHETIYQYIAVDKKAGGQLFKLLRHQNKTYRKRYGSVNNRTGIPNRIDIDKRPTAANNRERVGDWEADTIIGKNHQGAIVTLDERVSKLRLAMPIVKKEAQRTADAINALLTPLKPQVLTITFDNGKEFTQHEQVATNLQCDTYFAKPYHSWERGQNENANGLLRQYFPKAMELVDVTLKQVAEAVHKLNNRPRKCLGYKTPYEVFLELTGVDARNFVAVHL